MAQKAAALMTSPPELPHSPSATTLMTPPSQQPHSSSAFDSEFVTVVDSESTF